jgi:hypothetical protein
VSPATFQIGDNILGEFEINCRKEMCPNCSVLGIVIKIY